VGGDSLWRLERSGERIVARAEFTFSGDSNLHGPLRGIDGRQLKHGNEPFATIVLGVTPDITPLGFGVTVKREDFDYSFPNGHTFELLMDMNRLGMFRVAPVQLANCTAKSRLIDHVASGARRTRSAVDQSSGTTPAFSAGVIRNVACRFTRL